MRAVVWQGPHEVGVTEVPDPHVEEPTDAVVRVTSTCICGSDLHLFDHGASMGMMPGDVLGHEAVGEVVEVGSSTGSLDVGDRVVVPFNIACGSCYTCRTGMYSQCETTQNMGGRRGAEMFGYTHQYGGVPGAQAEYLRVPMAHFGPVKIDPSIPDPVAVLLADVLPTAWQACGYADLQPGRTVAINGLGPIGQMCVRIARFCGASVIVGVDPNPDRRAMAEAHGAITIDPGAGDVGEQVRSRTSGRGADSVIDAVGMDADGGVVEKVMQTAKVVPDRLAAFDASMDSVRRGGTLSVVGVYIAWYPKFPLGDLFDRQVTIRWGQANVRRWTDELMEHVTREDDPLALRSFVTHEVPLDQAPQWYEAFRDKQPGVMKVLMRPGLAA